jgi:hypothetical protein
MEGSYLRVQDQRVAINRGTPALIAAAIATGEVLKLPAPTVFLVGDTGQGQGSRSLYKWLSTSLVKYEFESIAFHYLQPDVDWHNQVLFAVQEMSKRPVLIADAGFMYAAKMSDQAQEYDLFTPDAGELAFLADENAPHPFYTRGFILQEENNVPDLIQMAYEHGNAPRHLLVKGEQDYIATKDGIQEIISHPSEEAMEAVGGSGDTLTGIVTAFIASGIEIGRAASLAAKTNRLAASYTSPTPATQIIEIIKNISKATLDLSSSNFE